MSMVGTVESLWRYPVKSMRGEALDEAYVAFGGLYGDRLFAFRNAAAPAGFPYLTGRERHAMITYVPRFRHPEKAARPSNLAAAQKIAPGINPVAPTPDELAVDVETPSGDTLPVDAPMLLTSLAGADGEGALTLLRSDKAMTDCRPVSLFSLQTARQLEDESGFALDKRRFRANFYLDLGDLGGFSEDSFVGRRLRIGTQVEVWVLERDPRCQMISLDPESGARNPAVLKAVAKGHEGKAGVYGAVLAEGLVRKGDPVELVG